MYSTSSRIDGELLLTIQWLRENELCITVHEGNLFMQARTHTHTLSFLHTRSQATKPIHRGGKGVTDILTQTYALS